MISKYLYVAGAAGWAAAAMLGWLWIQALQDIVEEREGCNADKLASVAAAEREARQAVEQASQARIAQLEQVIQKERQAREIAEDAAIIAESQAAEVREVIREVAVNDPDSCLNSEVPGEIVQQMRNQ